MIIPEELHNDFSRWIQSYKDIGVPIPVANKMYDTAKRNKLLQLAQKYSCNKAECTELFEKLLEFYNTDQPRQPIHIDRPKGNRKMKIAFYLVAVAALIILIISVFIGKHPSLSLIGLILLIFGVLFFNVANRQL